MQNGMIKQDDGLVAACSYLCNLKAWQLLGTAERIWLNGDSWQRHIDSLGLDTDDMLEWIASGSMFEMAQSIDYQRAVELNEKTAGGFVHFDSPRRWRGFEASKGFGDITDEMFMTISLVRKLVPSLYFDLQTKLPAPWNWQAFIAAINLGTADSSARLPDVMRDMLQAIDVVRQIEVRHAGGVTHLFSMDGSVKMPDDIKPGVPVEVTYAYEVPRKRRDNGKGRNKRRGR